MLVITPLFNNFIGWHDKPAKAHGILMELTDKMTMD